MFQAFNRSNINWEDATLILSCVSVGNVGQLSADLIISELKLNKVGFIYHRALLPVVGNDPYIQLTTTDCLLSTACEVYANKTCDIVVIQHRSPLVTGKKEEYSTWLSEWIKSQKFKQIVVLTSSFAHERTDQQIYGSQLRILMSPPSEENNGKLFLQTLKWTELEKRSCVSPYELDDSELCNDMIYLPGSGIAKHILNKCFNLRVLIMSVFCSEGNNIPDAVSLTGHLNTWLQLLKQDKSKPITWKIPESWNLCYGSNVDQTLFH